MYNNGRLRIMFGYNILACTAIELNKNGKKRNTGTRHCTLVLFLALASGIHVCRHPKGLR